MEYLVQASYDKTLAKYSLSRKMHASFHQPAWKVDEPIVLLIEAIHKESKEII